MSDPAGIRRGDVAAALALLAVTLVSAGPAPGSATAAGVVLAAALVLRRRHPAAAGMSAALALGGAVLVDVDAADRVELVLGVTVLAYGVGGLTEARRARAVGVAMLVATYGAQLVATGGSASPPLLFSVAGAWLAGGAVRSRRELTAELEDTVAALDAERATYVELAVERERRLIARELHDVVGHAMSLITIQATAGRHLAASSPAEAARSLSAIVEAGSQARGEVHRLRGVLDGTRDAAPGLAEIRGLVSGAAAAGVRVHLRGPPSDLDVDAATGQAAYRVVQEALTNALRHAAGAPVDVVLTSDGDQLTVAVRSGPGRPGADGARGGAGLAGMAERVAAVGGRLDAGPHDQGWQVRARLPLRPSCGGTPPARA